MTIKYIANDGTVFNNERECAEYEKHCAPYMLTRDFEETKDMDQGEYIYIRDTHDKKYLMDYFHDSFDDLPNTFDWWIFNPFDEKWYDINTVITHYMDLRNKLRSYEYNIR